MPKIIVLTMLVATAASASARSYNLKLIGSKETSEGSTQILNDKTMCRRYQLTVGGSTKRDGFAPITIKAATVMKNIKRGGYVINDVAEHTYNPTNRTAVFVITSGRSTRVEDNWKWVGSDYSQGWNVSGVIVEAYQGERCLKHLANVADRKIAKTKLTPEPSCEYMDEDGCKQAADCFTNKTTITEPED